MKIDRDDLEMLGLLSVFGAAVGLVALAAIIVLEWLMAKIPVIMIFALSGAVVGVASWVYVMVTTGRPIVKEAEG